MDSLSIFVHQAVFHDFCPILHHFFMKNRWTKNATLFYSCAFIFGLGDPYDNVVFTMRQLLFRFWPFWRFSLEALENPAQNGSPKKHRKHMPARTQNHSKMHQNLGILRPKTSTGSKRPLVKGLFFGRALLKSVCAPPQEVIPEMRVLSLIYICVSFPHIMSTSPNPSICNNIRQQPAITHCASHLAIKVPYRMPAFSHFAPRLAEPLSQEKERKEKGKEKNRKERKKRSESYSSVWCFAGTSEPSKSSRP